MSASSIFLPNDPSLLPLGTLRTRIIRFDNTIRLSPGRAYRVIQDGLRGCMVIILTAEEGHITFEHGDQTYVAARIADPGDDGMAA